MLAKAVEIKIEIFWQMIYALASPLEMISVPLVAWKACFKVNEVKAQG